jgi:hypothetical protein
MKPNVLLLELNEADNHFIQTLTKQGKLPSFGRVLAEGARCRTFVPGWDPADERAWRHISPWIVWPSLYTGLLPSEHRLVAFGQDNEHLVGKCVWDVLDAAGISTGVFGPLQSHPPRTAGNCRFYVPEALANDPRTIPAELEPLQEFFLFGARNYSESFLSQAAKGLYLLARSRRAGVRAGTMARTLGQVPAELLIGERQVPERAMLHTYLSRDAFLRLYATHRPRYASIHMNQVAYMQHRYWRAAEPERYRDELGPADAAWYATPGERRDAEAKFARCIERAFVIADDILGTLMSLVEPNTVILIATGLGQHPMDPAGEIHNPVVRLVDPERVLHGLGLRGFTVLHQMNPDLTVNFLSRDAAETAARALEAVYLADATPLFDVAQEGPQVFLELRLPPEVWSHRHLEIRHPELPTMAIPWHEVIHVRDSREQSTAHHHDKGLLMAWSPTWRVEPRDKAIPVTDVAPNILRLFDVPIPPWMNQNPAQAFDISPR